MGINAVEKNISALGSPSAQEIKWNECRLYLMPPSRLPSMSILPAANVHRQLLMMMLRKMMTRRMKLVKSLMHSKNGWMPLHQRNPSRNASRSPKPLSARSVDGHPVDVSCWKTQYFFFEGMWLNLFLFNPIFGELKLQLLPIIFLPAQPLSLAKVLQSRNA